MTTDLMILGSSHAELPLVIAAKKRGLRVTLVSGLRDGIAAAKADRHVLLDYSDSNKVLDLCRELRPRGVAAGCNDFAALTASHVAEALQLPGHDPLVLAKQIHLKNQFRLLGEELSIRAPSAQSFTNVRQAVEFIATQGGKHIVKPPDLTGGKGVAVVDSNEDPGPSLERALSISRADEVVVERFVEGTLHSLAAVIKGRKIDFFMVADERSLDDPFLVSAAETPSVLSENTVVDLVAMIEKLAQSTELVDGLVHVQFIFDGHVPWIIEICRRPPGDLYLDLVRMAVGYDLAGSYIDQCLGIVGETYDVHPPDPVLRQCVLAQSNGDVGSITYSSLYSDALVESTELRKLPTLIKDYKCEKLRIDLCRFASPEILRSVSAHIRDHVRVAYNLGV